MWSRLRQAEGKEPAVVSSLVASLGIVRLVVLWLGTDARLAMNIPDDAFYYLVLAKNYALSGHWTFDSVEPATGFHLLWGYFLALIYKVMPGLSLHAVFGVAGFAQVVSLAVASFLFTRTANRLFGRGAGWGVATVFLSATVLAQGGWLMESAFVICLSAATVDLLARPALRLSGEVVAGCVFLGWGLEMARSDAGLLAGFLLLMHLALLRRGPSDRSMLVAAAAALSGSVLGLATLLLHTHFVSGGWLQASAQQKLFWSKVAGRNSLRSILGIPLSVLQPLHNAVPHFSSSIRWLRLSNELGHIMGAALLMLAVIGATLRVRRSYRIAKALPITLVLLTAAYCVVYQNDGAVLYWYVENFVACMTLLTAASAAWFLEKSPRLSRLVIGLVCVSGFWCSLVPTFPWQESMYRAGVYLHDHPLDGGQGAFNAGIVGYFTQHPFVNLDGLVNDSILPYAKSDTLAAYMARRDVTYIFDSPFMLQDPTLQRRGGYSGGKLLRCLRDSMDMFPDDPNNNWENEHIHLYRFDRACLAGGSSIR